MKRSVLKEQVKTATEKKSDTTVNINVAYFSFK